MSVLPNISVVSNLWLSSALSAINSNFNNLKNKFSEVLWRDGSNVMTGNLDMNSKRLLNVAPAILNSDAPNWGQVLGLGGGGGSGGVPEAPTDGNYYARKSSGWTAFSPGGGGGGIPEAPLDSKIYGRKNSAWNEVSSDTLTYKRPTAAEYRTLTSKLADRQDALDYIPVSLHPAILAQTSIEPIAGYLTPAFTGSTADTLYFRKGQYGWEAEQDTNGKRIVGAGRDQCRLVALNTGLRSMFRLRGQNSLVDGFYLVADYANYGLWIEGSNGTEIVRNSIEGARIAGVKFAANMNNSSCHLRSNLIRYNGLTYSCGTGAIPAGGGLFTITGVSINPSTLATAGGTGPRLGFDFVRVGSYPAWEVVSFTSNSITVYTSPNSNITAGSGLPVVLRQGSGVEISSHGDNSDIKLYNNAIQSNVVAGIDNQALYGVLAEGNTLEYNHYGTVNGRRASGGEHVVINTTYDTNYTEANGGGAGYYIGSVRQFVIRNIMADGIAYLGLDDVRIADRNTMYDINFSTSGITGTKRTIYEASAAVGPITVTLGSVTHLEVPTANCTITVESLIGGTNASSLASYTDVKTEVLLGNMNGKTLTIRCANYLVNDIAASGGFSSYTVPAGNYKRVIISFEGTYGLRVTTA